MSNTDWVKIKKIFDVVVEQPKEKQLDYLKSQCGDDNKLYEEILKLLKADESPNALLDDFVISAIDIVEDQKWDGKHIGKYRIEKQIGTGGMGNVFLAHRDDGQYKQKVALKVIKRGMDSEEILNRFTAERQILARLQHPNIASLLDGGVTDQGQPYFCMEYIDGESIISYTERNQLSVDARLQLFETVCKAVQYAQHNLVVHRDLKPSNILIDKSGAVKLLDFGIAKVLGTDPDDTFVSDLTKTGLRVMTPGYASPEQIKGELVTTASDVYSLGVVLYELLTGRRPFKLKGLTPKQMEEVLDVSEPSKPSADLDSVETILPSSPEESSDSSLSTRSKHEVDQLRRKLSGDLDNICLMALRRDPERRYSSAGQFQDDIERYLSGMPVKARPDTFSYRMQKFIGRHKTAMVSLVILFVLISSMISFYTWKLANERDRAQEEALKSEQVSDFLISLFEAADPNISKGEEITARELLEQGAERIDTELADQPQVKADMLLLIGKVYSQIGDLELSKEFYNKALQVQLELTGELSEETSLIYGSLGVLAYDLSNYDSSIVYYEKAIEIVTTLFGEDDPRVSDNLNDLATSLRVQGEEERAEEIFRKCLALRLELYGENNLDVAHTLNHLGRLLYSQGRYDEAKPLLSRGLMTRKNIHGEDHMEVVASKGTMSQLYKLQGNLDSAKILTTESLNTLIKLVGLNHHYVGGVSNTLGNIYREMGEFEKSLEMNRQSLTVLQNSLPEGHFNLSFPYEGLGYIFFEMKEYDSSVTAFSNSLKLRKKTLPHDHLYVKQIETGLAQTLIYTNEFKKAESLLLPALNVFMEKSGQDHRYTKIAKSYLVQLYDRWGKPDQADQYRLPKE